MVNRSFQTNFVCSYRFLLFCSLCLIGLGGATRAMDAGLACPDWPLCFGQLVPDFHAQVYFEFLHRALAGSVGCLVAVLNGWLIFKRGIARSIKWVAAGSILVLFAQVILGALTVWKLLHSGIVTLHLGFGVLLFSSLFWIYWQLRARETQLTRANTLAAPLTARALAWFLVAATYMQILLGGWVASNYAGLACRDFPTCQGQWIPPMVGSVAIQMIHRFGAYALTLLVVLHFVYLALQRKQVWMRPEALNRAAYAMALILIQICLGVMNVVFTIPPVITVLHLLIGVTLLAVHLAIAQTWLPRELSDLSASSRNPAGVRDVRAQRPAAQGIVAQST